ncbi:hypothetical protein FVA95_17405 [Pseudonocardia sp. EV170527-09]|uniref:hypothetical protein n=1 Tax=Pseudonocardia sp. EV170527-09 TaxID=2603411 RepID=UPI0011F2D2F9|nr:hypothetical protein [Pseudonocardia sp. EV170527-09]KAA1024773.1 hypothetical protein FVA95_17405 [Pseudonocardia sp. EV170527-09]
MDSFEIISAPPANPVVRVLALLLRLRAELTVAAVLVAVWVWLGPDHARDNAGRWVAVPGTGWDTTTRTAVLVAAALVLAGLPWTRRFLFHRAQAVLTRHRVRQTLLECRVLNSRSRACPLTVWARPTRVGEAVWVVLRAGISPTAVAEQVEELASACFARDARVIPWPRFTNVVRVETIRRDPLAPNLIRSDLFRYASGDIHDPGWPSSDSPDSPAPAPRREPSRPALPAAPQPAFDRSVDNGRGGDWSDYV